MDLEERARVLGTDRAPRGVLLLGDF